MQDIRYHPLIDRNSEGTDKVPMFFSENETAVRKAHDLYLEEIVPKHYRLCSVSGTSSESAKDFTIRCPYCGKAMIQIANARNTHRLGLYNCPDCRKNESEEKSYE